MPRAASKPVSPTKQANGFDHTVSGDTIILGSNSSPALTANDRELSDVSEIGRNSRQNSAGRLRTPTKQVTLPTVKRRDQTREAWSEVNGNMAEPSSSSMNGTSRITNGDHGDRNHDDDDDSDSSDSEEEERRAPDQLRLEFLECLMKKEYHDALKLCKMILIYEPKNPEANSFLPLIGEKIELDARPRTERDEEGGEGDEEEEDDEDEDDEDDDDDDDGDDDDDDDDDSSSSDDDDESTEEEDEEEDEDEEQESLVRAVLQSRLDGS